MHGTGNVVGHSVMQFIVHISFHPECLEVTSRSVETVERCLSVKEVVSGGDVGPGFPLWPEAYMHLIVTLYSQCSYKCVTPSPSSPRNMVSKQAIQNP